MDNFICIKNIDRKFYKTTNADGKIYKTEKSDFIL